MQSLELPQSAWDVNTSYHDTKHDGGEEPADESLPCLLR